MLAGIMLKHRLSALKFLVVFAFCLTGSLSHRKQGCRGSTIPRQDPTSCQSYFQCLGGIQYRARCAPGTVFSKQTKKCEKSVKIPCSADKNSGTPLEGETCTLNGEIRPSEIDCEKFLLCRVKYYVVMSCPFGLIFSNVKYRCIEPSDRCLTEAESGTNSSLKELDVKKANPYIGICDNRTNEVVPEPFDCSMYILCEEDAADAQNAERAMSILECDKGTLFNAIHKKCLPPSQVVCGERYRVINLYGKDLLPIAVGRSVGSPAVKRAAKGMPEIPKHWAQPGKYRAISNHTSTDTRRTPKSPSLTIILSSVDELTTQKSVENEGSTPTAQSVINEGTSPPIGRTIKSKTQPTNNSKPLSAGSVNTELEARGRILPENSSEQHRHASHVLLKIVVGDGSQQHAAHVLLQRNGAHEVVFRNARKKLVEPTSVQKEDIETHPADPISTLERSHVEAEGLSHELWSHERGLSSESDEHAPFPLKKSGRRVPKPMSFLEDYHATLNGGQRLDSTNADTFDGGDDDSYVGHSSENGTDATEATTAGTLLLESSLELSHHTSARLRKERNRKASRKPLHQGHKSSQST